MLIGIVAVAANLAIGKNGKLPWHHPADLKFFQRTTIGHAVVMGFATWSAIGMPLPDRLNVVLSREKEIEHQPNVILMRDKDEVIALKKFLSCDLFIIGGAKTYENFADVIEKWIVTRIPEKVEDADVFMPRDFTDGFDLREIIEIAPGLNAEVFHRREQLM